MLIKSFKLSIKFIPILKNANEEQKIGINYLWRKQKQQHPDIKGLKLNLLKINDIERKFSNQSFI